MTMKKLLALLVSLALLTGAVVALGEGLVTQDGILVEAPVAEEAEAELWTDEMEEAGEQAVSAGEELTSLYFMDEWSRSTDDFIVLNVPDPVMENDGSGFYQAAVELLVHMDLSETLTSVSSSDESVVAAQIVEGSEGTEGSYYSYMKINVQAVKKGNAVLSVTTSLGRSASIDINVAPFEYLPIDAALFPDPAFRKFLLSFFRLEEGEYLLPNTRALSITKIDYDFNGGQYLKDAGIMNFQGIERFPALEELYLGGGDFESLDLSGNTKLQIVDLSYCENLKSLNISGCSDLEALQATCCALTSLDVSHCPNLYVLVCDQNDLKSLDVSHCPKLRVLNAVGNKLTGTLDVSKCPELLELYCQYNDIGALNITGCPTLIRCFEKGGVLNEEYSYVTVKGNGFTNTRKAIVYDEYETAVRIGDVVHAPLTPTAAPTATVAPTAAATEAPAGQIEVESSLNYLINGKGTAATITGVDKSAKTIVIPDTVTVRGKKVKVTAIADKAFYKDGKLTAVTVGKYVKTIGRNAFYGCATLKTVKGGAAVTTIKEGAFQGCKALTAITLNSKVTTLGKKAFYGCAKLKTVTIKTAKLTAKTVGASAFKGINAAVTFKCPKKQLKAYKALLKKKGAPKKAKYK